MKATTKPVTFNDKTRSLYRWLKDRGRVDFTLAEFREWLQSKAKGDGSLWCCEYSGAFLAINKVSIDHRYPVALGGHGTLKNLAVCTERLNRIKGSIPHDQFVKLKRTVEEEWPCEAQTAFWQRLAQKPTWGGRSRKSKAAQFVAEFNRGRK